MANNPERPGPNDAVLGGRSQPPVTGAVLGGIEGIKQRLSSGTEKQRIAALSDALNYGAEGLELAIASLKDAGGEVALAAWKLLQNRTEPQAQHAVEKYLPLLSDVDMVYFRLRDLLAAKQWSDADRQTRSILLRICKREEQWLRRKDIQKLPRTDLGTLDRLWTYYSQGHFGFSTQLRIWKESKEANKFGDRVGWRIGQSEGRWGEIRYLMERRADIPCDLNAPAGHLPTVCAFGGGESYEEPYTNDTESTMGFYSIDGYWTIWSSDSFFGPEMVDCFFKRIQACEL